MRACVPSVAMASATACSTAMVTAGCSSSSSCRWVSRAAFLRTAHQRMLGGSASHRKAAGGGPPALQLLLLRLRAALPELPAARPTQCQAALELPGVGDRRRTAWPAWTAPQPCLERQTRRSPCPAAGPVAWTQRPAEPFRDRPELARPIPGVTCLRTCCWAWPCRPAPLGLQPLNRARVAGRAAGTNGVLASLYAPPCVRPISGERR